MTILELQQRLLQHPNVAAMYRLLDDSSIHSISCRGLMGSSAPVFFSSLHRHGSAPCVFVLADMEEAGYFYHDMTQILGDENVLFFPSSFRRAVKYGQKDAANVILRAQTLSRLEQQQEGRIFIVTYPDALAEKVVSKKELGSNTLTLNVGEEVDMAFITDVLRSYGFKLTDYVYEPGQFAERGSIIDVFSYSSEYPFRIDFFGDEVSSIRPFEVESQISFDKKESITIFPDLDKDLSQGDGSGMVAFTDFLPADTVLFAGDFVWLTERIRQVHDEALSPQALTARKAEEEGPDDDNEVVSLEGKLIDGAEFAAATGNFRRVDFGTHPDGTPQATLTFGISPQPLFHKNFDLLTDSFKDYISRGYTLYICSDSTKQTDRLRAIFDDRGDTDIAFTPVEHTVHEGYSDDDLKVCVFTDHQIFDRFHKYSLKSDRVRGGKMALSLKELSEFQPGDYVVHIDHGVGRFAGLVRIPAGNTTQEVMKIVYQNDDVVFVSIHSLHKVSKYKGRDNEPPRLNRLGTGAWEKLKERTKKKIKDIARDLIRLYAARRQEKGFSFGADSFLQKELEASFLYEDTPDQSRATADVKADMESERPMDRLVCGDVGFGKTEVAIRAAFKAVADDKQVAVLVPTTVLAYQHYHTFSERLKDMPCRVDYLTRARSATDVKKMLCDLSEGNINILIGTQRILGKDVKFHDLGLLIVDEEQKFGVSTKEKLRQLKVNVDTLTLSATPIPRTLQFSLMGARDLSVIQTPPPNRYPIQTELHVFNEEVIADAVNFEMSRNGQVFFVNNRIANLQELKAMILRHVPDCRICIGHGQMAPEELEEVITGFVNYDYDVLLSTTIVENGIDIPNANTIIINDAQNFGLSDLHQMRGRVGRSNKKAFCYLLSPPLSVLTSEARRRLQAIENYAGLGSGIHIAMQDLDIRGAGNMLGAEQSGFIADMGYDTYQKILSEAVHELKTGEFSQVYANADTQHGNGADNDMDYVDECQVESDLELLLPATYVTGSSERMLLYRELDNLTSDEEVEQYRARLEDRFGPVPKETDELLRVVPLRRMAARLGAEKVFLKGGKMTLFLVSNPDSPYYQGSMFGRLIDYMMKNTRRCELREKPGDHRRSMSVANVPTVREALAVVTDICQGK